MFKPALPARPAAWPLRAGRWPRPRGALPVLFALAVTAATHGSVQAAPAAPGEVPCDDLARRLPNVTLALCQDAQLRPTGARSVQGRTLWQRDVEPAAPDAPLPAEAGSEAVNERLAERTNERSTERANDRGPERAAERGTGAAAAPRRVLVVGGIHGDELSSASLVLHWIGQAVQSGTDIKWRLVPLMNPDGALKDQPTRTNARGVDLNRNFPTPGWAEQAPRYWKQQTKKDPRRFPGTAPLSEPETRWLHDEMEQFKPNLIVSVHAPYGVLDFDGPSVPPERLGRLYLDRVGIFPGSLGNYGGVHKNIPVVTIELSSALRTPTDAETRQMWQDLLRWIDERLPVGAVADTRKATVSIDCSRTRSVVAVSARTCADEPLPTRQRPNRGGS